MSNTSTQNRLEYLDAVASNLRKVKATNELQANNLVKVVFGEKYDLSDKKDTGRLLDAIDEEISTRLRPEMISKVESSIEETTRLGINQTISERIGLVGMDSTKYMTLGERLADRYINRPMEDGLKLSDKVWSNDDIKSVYKEVYESIKRGDSNFTLAANIEKQVAEGTPAYNIKRVVHNEMTYAYNNSKYDIAKAEADEYGLDTWARITVSKSHATEDECDDNAGEYPLEDAPIPPFHPNCSCTLETFVKRK